MSRSYYKGTLGPCRVDHQTCRFVLYASGRVTARSGQSGLRRVTEPRYERAAFRTSPGRGHVEGAFLLGTVTAALRSPPRKCLAALGLRGAPDTSIRRHRTHSPQVREGLTHQRPRPRPGSHSQDTVCRRPGFHPSQSQPPGPPVPLRLRLFSGRPRISKLVPVAMN